MERAFTFIRADRLEEGFDDITVAEDLGAKEWDVHFLKAMVCILIGKCCKIFNTD